MIFISPARQAVCVPTDEQVDQFCDFRNYDDEILSPKLRFLQNIEITIGTKRNLKVQKQAKSIQDFVLFKQPFEKTIRCNL